MKFSTRAIHSHQSPDPTTGAVITPIYQTSTFQQEDAGVFKGWEYTRCGNPTIEALEGVLADLEGGRHGFVFSSGMGALVTLCYALFKPGDHLLVGDDVYGGTYRFLTKIFHKFGIESSFVNMSDPAEVERQLRPNTRMIYLETPTNPLLKLVDIAAVAQIAKKRQIPTCIDNTFATPYLQQPFDLGVDIILHSTTKYIGGHSDVVGGALILKDETYKDAVRFHLNSMGANADPFAAWLTLRGVKTLGVRMETHCRNAMALAQFLEGHPAVQDVIYPGLPSHPQHALAKKQMKAFGGMISLRIRGQEAEARAFMKNLKIFTLAESLGGVESLVEHPGLMTHLSVEKQIKDAIGITDNLVRLSIGIEDVEDLQADLDQALRKVQSSSNMALA